jgi:hypothetical protein
MTYLKFFAVALFLASQSLTFGIEILSQNFELSTFTQVYPIFGGPSAQDQDTRQNQGFGDRFRESHSNSALVGVSVFSDADLTLRRTNNLSSDVLFMQGAFAMRSEDVAHAGATQMVLRATAAMNISLQVRSETPFHFRIATAGLFAPSLPGAGGISIRNANGNAFVDINWTSGTDSSSESQGTLPPGNYHIRFFNNATADGTFATFLKNHISGTTLASATVSFSPAPLPPATRPSLRMVRGTGDLLQIELSNLLPGTNYFLDRADSLDPSTWQFLSNFVAAGTNALYTDSLISNTQNVFYRLYY